MTTSASRSAESVPAATVLKLAHPARPLRGPSLLAVISGAVRVRVGSRRDSLEVLRVEAGDLVALSRGQHATIAACGGFAEVVVLEVGEVWADRARRLAGVGSGAQGVPLFVERGGTPIARRAYRLLVELGAPCSEVRASERLRAVAKLIELLAVLSEERSEVLVPGARRVGGRRAEFRAAVERLASGSLEELTLERFARRIGFSPRHVSRLFREEFGTTFRDHLVDLRLERAKELLERTQHSIISVAGETGWSSLAHFNSVFRRRIGATPTKYRAQRGLEPAS